MESVLLVCKQLGFRNQSKNKFKSKIKKIENILTKLDINFKTCFRNELINQKFDNDFDLIITFGGDGTFLETCRFIKNNATVLGVNSDPNYSAGSLCAADVENVEWILKEYLNKKIFPVAVVRLKIEINSIELPVVALNDILITNSNPAAMTCYDISINENIVSHRNSGLWICTPCGSTGATCSAGGYILNMSDRLIQWTCRESYYLQQSIPYFLSGFLKPSNKIIIQCNMKYGQLYVDGAHYLKELKKNDILEISFSDTFLNILFTKESEMRRKKIASLREQNFRKKKSYGQSY